MKKNGQTVFEWSGSADDDSAIEAAWKNLDEDEKIDIGTPMEDAKVGYQK